MEYNGCMPPSLRVHLRKNLTLSLFDALFYSLMVGLSESYVPAFALFLGVGEADVGVLASLPLLLGALLQLVSPWILPHMKSHKRWVVGSTFIQALSLIPLVVLALRGQGSFTALMLACTLYWGAGYAAGPAWNYWMGFLIPRPLSSGYFSLRAIWAQSGVLVGLVAGGLLLQLSTDERSKAWLYAIVFGAAAFSRMVSSALLSRKSSEPAPHLATQRYDFFESLKIFLSSQDRRKFFGFLFLFYSGVYLSSAFVAPYLLAQNHFSYIEFMACLAVFLLAKVLVSRVTSPLINRFGVEKILLLGAFGVTPLPALWVISDSVGWALFLQTLSGAFWGSFEVCLTLIFFNHIPHKEKVVVLTLHNLFNALAITIGGLLGHLVLNHFGVTKWAYNFLFVLSTSMRLACLIPFYKLPLDVVAHTPGVLRNFIVGNFNSKKSSERKVS